MKARVTKTVAVPIEFAERMERAKELDPSLNWTALAMAAWEAAIVRAERKEKR